MHALLGVKSLVVFASGSPLFSWRGVLVMANIVFSGWSCAAAVALMIPLASELSAEIVLPKEAGKVMAESDEVDAPAVPLKEPQAPAAAPKEGEDRNQLNALPGRVKPVAKRPTGKIPLVSKVTDDISREARKGWAASKDWPHDQADYSSRTDAALLNRQLIQTLMKRQDNHPAVDGYIRWQLLSFAPDLSEAKPQEIRSMVANLPELTRLPVPPQSRNILKPGDTGGGAYFFSGVQRAFISDLRPVAGARGYNPTLSVVNTGNGLSFETPEEIIEASRSAAYDHVQSRPLIERLNIPAVNYRTALMELIPSDAGLKLECLFIDLKDRIESGDASYKDACQAFFTEAHRMRNDTTIPEKTRANLAYQMRNLGMKKTLVLKEIQINQAGDMKVDREAVAFPKQHLDQLLEYLRGPVVKAE